MSKPDRNDAGRGVQNPRHSDAPAGKPAQTPAAPAELGETPDEAVKGRDRLSENEQRPMDPGVSDSANS